MALAFQSQGALPTPIAPPNYSNIFSKFQGSNPVSSALNKAQGSSTLPTGQYVPKPTITPQSFKPTTPVKKITSADGTTTEFHAPTTSGLIGNSSKTPGQDLPLNPPGSPGNAGPGPKPQLTPSVTLPNGQQGFTNEKGDLVDANGNPMPASTINNQAPNTNPPTSYQGLIGSAQGAATGNEPIGQSAADIAARYGQQIADVGQLGAKAQAGYKTTGTTPVGEGNAAIQAQSTAAQQTALATGEQAALAGTSQQLTAQNQQATALTNLANLAPELLRYGGSANMTPAEAQVYKSNLSTAGDLATKINNLNSVKDAADAGFTRLINAAGSLGGDTPIAQGIATLAGTTIQGSPEATAFLTQLAAARQQWSDLGLGDPTTALPDNITKKQLQQAQQTMEKQISSNLTNLNGTLNDIKKNPTGTSQKASAVVVETNPDGTPKAMSF